MIKIGFTKSNCFIVHSRPEDGERITLKLFFRGFTPIEEKLHRCRHCGGLTVTDDNNCLQAPPQQN